MAKVIERLDDLRILGVILGLGRKDISRQRRYR